MRTGYVLLAVAVALVIGFAVGALASGDGDSDDPTATRSDSVAGGTSDQTTNGSDTTDDAGQPPGSETDPDTGGDQGTERAPDSANDPRPPAPDDVIGERPGAGGDEDDGQ